VGEEKKKPRARCPQCDSWISPGNSIKQGDFVGCPVCKTYLEIVSLHPLTLDYAEDGEWYDEEYDQYEETDLEDETF
jgi:hypothetical protein